MAIFHQLMTVLRLRCHWRALDGFDRLYDELRAKGSEMSPPRMIVLPNSVWQVRVGHRRTVKLALHYDIGLAGTVENLAQLRFVLIGSQVKFNPATFVGQVGSSKTVWSRPGPYRPETRTRTRVPCVALFAMKQRELAGNSDCANKARWLPRMVRKTMPACRRTA